jgi:hypothetical protein
MDMLRVAEGGLELLESIPHAKRGSGDENGTGGGISECGFRNAESGEWRGFGKGGGGSGNFLGIQWESGSGGFLLVWEGVVKWGEWCWVGDDGF